MADPAQTTSNAANSLSTLILGASGEDWDKWLIWSVGFAALAAVAVGVVTTGSILAHKREAIAAEEALKKFKLETDARVAEADEKGKTATEHAARLAVELEQAKNNAKQIDANLLREQRLTSNERWRLTRLERAVLPRSAFVNWGLLVEKLKALKIEQILIAKPVDENMETSILSLQLTYAFQQAGTKVDMFSLTAEELKRFGQSASGLFTIIVDAKGQALADMLWVDFQMGGGSSSQFPDIKPEIPRNLNCLVLGPNNWAVSPGSGQAGEGVDQNGRPVPPP